MPARVSVWLAVVTCAFVTTLAMAAARPAPVASRQLPSPPPPDASELFAKLYPVFTHPRCINCHGVVQSVPGMIRSVTAETHPGGAQGTGRFAAECSSCHDESPEVEKAWEFTAPQSMAWVGKSVEQLCAMQAAQVGNFNKAAGGADVSRPGSYMNHLTTDPLITQAFRGRAGGAFDPTKASDPPPMTRADFLIAATRWVDAGAPCRPSGSVTQVEHFQANYSFTSQRGRTSVQEVGRREVQVIRMPDGTAVADVTTSGHRTLQTVAPATGRFGPCEFNTVVDVTWSATPQRGVRADLSIDARTRGYEISFLVPADTTTQRTVTTVTNTCGDPNPSVPTSNDDPIEWEPWRFVIRCPATFPQDADNRIACDPVQHQSDRRLSGSLSRRIQGQTDADERQTWLNESPMGIARSDTGAPLAITIRTTWHLNLDR